MVIWLRQSRVAVSADERAGIGVGARVLRREEYAAAMALDECVEATHAQCERLLAEASEHAAAIVAQAESDAQQLLERAQTDYAEAASRGYEDGTRRAAEEWFARSAQAMADRKAVQISLRERMAELVVAAVEQITRHEDRSVLFARAVTAVERLVEGADYLKVRVHPDDYEVAQREFKLASAGWNKGGRAVVLSVSPDRTLALGSCLCESDLGIVDASLDVQLNAVRDAVTRAVERSEANGNNAIEADEMAIGLDASEEDAEDGEDDDMEDDDALDDVDDEADESDDDEDEEGDDEEEDEDVDAAAPDPLSDDVRKRDPDADGIESTDDDYADFDDSDDIDLDGLRSAIDDLDDEDTP
jgi:type III secretion protein L